jgi:toxin CcdB
LTHLTPRLVIEKNACLMMTPQLAGVPVKELGDAVVDLSLRREEIIRATDLLVTGF